MYVIIPGNYSFHIIALHKLFHAGCNQCEGYKTIVWVMEAEQLAFMSQSSRQPWIERRGGVEGWVQRDCGSYPSNDIFIASDSITIHYEEESLNSLLKCRNFHYMAYLYIHWKFSGNDLESTFCSLRTEYIVDLPQYIKRSNNLYNALLYN